MNIANVPMPGWAAILLALALCALLGLVNAFGLTVIGIPSFIMTLAMMQIAAGISALLVRGQIAYKVPPLVTTLGSASIGGIPWIVIVAALMLLGGHLVLTYTRFGRYVYMVGGNREAAEYSGLNVKLILGSVMVISAVCSGIGGMLGVAHFGSAQQNEFDTYLLDLDRRRRGRRHQPVRRPRRHRQHHRRPVRARRPQQRPRPRQHRQLPEDPDPRPDPARSARHQRLCAAVARPGGRLGGFDLSRRNPAASRATSRAALVTAPMVGNDGRVHHHRAREPQAARLADGPPLADPRSSSKSILCARPRMRRMIFAAENPTVSLEQPRHIGQPLGLQPRRAGSTCKQRRPDRRRRLASVRHSSRNLRANSVQTLSIVSSTHASNSTPLARRALVAGGGQIAHQEIGDDGADIEPHRSVESELGIDHHASRLSVTMIDPVWRSPWISASGEAMNLSLSREIATCRSRSSRNARRGRVEPGLRSSGSARPRGRDR